MKYDHNARNCPTVVNSKAVSFHFHILASHLLIFENVINVSVCLSKHQETQLHNLFPATELGLTGSCRIFSYYYKEKLIPMTG